MLQDFLQLIPDEPTTVAMVIAMIGTVVGAALWLLGAKMSRPTVTLFTVLSGAALGMHLPQWFGWNISGAGPAVGAAVVLGVSGFVLHRAWIGIGLGSLMALWTAVAIWLCLHGTQEWNWPGFNPGDTLWSYMRESWTLVPTEVAKMLPYACGMALVAGLAATILWPRLATAIHWSVLGVSMVVTMGITAMAFGAHAWLNHLPQQSWAQIATLAVMVGIGTVIQWQLQPKPAAPPRRAAAAESSSAASSSSSADASADFFANLKT
jgi:hypothetical protein